MMEKMWHIHTTLLQTNTIVGKNNNKLAADYETNKNGKHTMLWAWILVNIIDWYTLPCLIVSITCLHNIFIAPVGVLKRSRSQNWDAAAGD